MKRIWGFGREKGMSPLGSASGLQRQGRGVGQKNNTTDNLLLGYHVQDRDLRKIHKAACVGTAAQAQQILFLGGNGVDDRDKMNSNYEIICRHKEEIMLKNSLQNSNPGSDKNAEEDSITRLSNKPGPDDSWPTSSSQVLHFGTKSMSEKPNKDVPHFSGAVDQKGQRILHGQVEGSDEKAEEDSITRRSDTPVPDDSWSTSASQDFDFRSKSMSEKPNKDVPHFSGAVDQKGQRILHGQVEGSDEKAEEDSITRRSDTPVPDDSWSTSASQDFDFRSKSMSEKPNKDVPHFSGAVDQKGQRILHGQVEGSDEKAEEDSITRRSDTPVPDDSWSTSASQDFDFRSKNVPKSRIAKLLHSSWKFIKNMRPKRGTMKPGDGTLSEDNHPHSENKDMAETLSKPPVRVYGDPLPVLPSSKSLLKPSFKMLAVLGLAKSMSEKPNKYVPPVSGAVDQKGQRILHGQVEGADKNAEEDSIARLSDKPGPDDSWSTSSSQVLDFGTKSMSEKPNKYVPPVSGAVDQKGQRILHGQVEGADKNAEEDSIARLSDKPGPDDSWSTSSSQVLDFGTKSMSEKPNKYVPPVSGAVDQKGQRILHGQVEGADKNAEEDSIARLSDKPGPDDSWSTSSSQVLDFGTKSMSEKPNKYVPPVSGAVDQKGQRILHGQVEGADKNAEEDSIARLSDKPGPDDSWSTSSSQVLDFGTKSMSEKPNKYVPPVSGAVDQKGQRILHGQVEGADKNAEEDSIARLSDKPGPDDSWSTSSSQVLDFGTKSMSEKPNKYVPPVSGAVDQKGQRILHGQVEGADKNAEEDSIARLSDKPGPDDSWSTSSSQVLDFGTKSMSEKPNKYVPPVSGAVDQKGQRILHGQVEGADKNAEEDSIARLSDKPGPDDSWSTSSSQVLDFGTKSMSEKPNKYVPPVSGAVDQKGQRILHGQVEGADKNAEEDSIARLSDKPGPDDSWSTSSSQVLDFGTKSMSEKPNKYVPPVSGAVDQKGQRILHGQVEGADKNAEEDSIARLSDKPGPDDSWSTSSSQVLDFGTKSMSEKPNKYVPHVSGAVDQKGQRILHGQVEGADKNAEEDSIARLSDKPGPDDSWSTSSSQVLDFGTKSMSEKPNKYVPHVSGAVDQKGQRILHGQVEGADKNAEEDSIARLSDKPGPDDSWSTSSSQVLDFGTKSMSEKPNKYVPPVSGAVDQKGQRILHGQVEGADKNAEEDSIARLSDKPGPDDSWSTSSSQVLDFGTKYQVPLKVEEKKKHRGSDMEVSENIYDAAAAGLIPQRQNGKTDNHQLPITENKDSDRREPGLHMKKLKKGENEKGTSKGSVITPVLQKADALTGGPLQKNDGSHFSEKDQHESRPAKKISKKKNKVKKQITSMDDLVDFIQSSKTASEHCELPYSKNFMLLIEQLGMDCKDYAGFLKIQDIRVSYEKLRKLNKKHCKLLMGKMTKMDKMVSALQNELQEAKDMISRLEHQKVEWEREFCSLRFTLKQEEEEEEEEERRNTDMLYENIREKLRSKEDEYKKEVETKQQVELALRMLNTELKATKNQVVEERSDTQWQLSPEQKARVLQDGSLNNLFCKQKELEMAHKKTNSKVVARQLQQELADTLKKKSMSEASPEVTSYLRLEDETRDLKKKLAQITSQLQEEQERHGEAVRCAQEMKDHVQKLQVKNATQEATIKHQAAQIQDLENNMIKTSLLQEAQERHAEAERYAEKIKDHMLKLKVKNARQEATIKHQAAQIQDLQSNLLKASLLQEAQERHAEAERYAEKIKDHMLKLKVKNARQEATIKHQAAQIQDLQSNLLKASLLQEAKDREAKDIRYVEKTLEVQNARAEETIKQQAAQIHNLPSNLLKTSLADVLTTELETTSSKYLHLDAKNQVLQESLSMRAFKEECEKLESNNKKLQQEVVKLKQFMEMNMVQRSQVEQYKQEIEERARLDIVEKLHEVNLFLQAQAAARQNLDQLRENDHASMRNQMELRIKDLESQVSTMKTSQDSTKTELETYRQLYLEELKLIKSLRNKLNRAKERLSESNTNFLVERQQHQTLLRTLTMSPGLEPPYCGHFENNLVLNGNLTPRGNLVIPTLNPRPSYDDREASLWKMRQELEERITRALEEDATKFE